MKLCDLTQFYSPLSGGVKRYVHEKIAYIQSATTDEHVLVVPGPKTVCVTSERSRIYFIHSPLISRTSHYRALINLRAIEQILERERPDLIESGDPYQVAWKAIASGEALRIPVVGFYHSHFPEAYVRSAAKFLGQTAGEAMMDFTRRYVRNLYNSFQATVSRRLHRGLYFQAAYTYSRTIDNVSGSLATDELNATRNGQGGANLLNIQDSAQANKARGDFDRPHRLVVSYSYDIPTAKSGMFSNAFFKGWAISGIVTYQSGLPFSITDNTSGAAFGGGTGTGVLVCRPLAEQISTMPGCTPGSTSTLSQLLTTGRIQDRLVHYLNPNFVKTADVVPNGAAGATGYGNTPRNAFRGPFQQNWDFSVQKRFSIKEGHEFQFRMDMFNMWNHPVFGFPNTVAIATPSTFGQITNTVVPARLIQFGVSYRH